MLIVFYYDITNFDSFKKSDYWNNQIKYYNNKYSILLIGNKINLDNQRVVNFNYAQNLSKKINCQFFETLKIILMLIKFLKLLLTYNALFSFQIFRTNP
jgi:GTPase SAR1 family protein